MKLYIHIYIQIHNESNVQWVSVYLETLKILKIRTVITKIL